MQKNVFRRQWVNIQDQGKEGACTAYAMVNIINGFKEPKFKANWINRSDISGHDYFSLVNKSYPEALQGSLAPIQALVYAKNNGFISLYQQLFIKKIAIKNIVNLLKEGFLFLVTITKYDLTATKKDKSFILKKGSNNVAHSVALVDYDDNKKLLKFANSYGSDWGDNGYFYMNYEDAEYFIDQLYAVYDSDDTENMQRLAYKVKLLEAINIISEQWQRGTEEEQKAMNLANTILRKVVLNQDHQYNMQKQDLINLINKYF